MLPGIFWVVPAAGVIAIIFAIIMAKDVLKRSPGTKKMEEVGSMIFEGAWAFLKRQYTTIGWLAVVNTALAFTLWNHTQRTLSAVESSIINNTMTIQIAILAWVFLSESLTPREIGGLALAGVGTLIVQVRRAR